MAMAEEPIKISFDPTKLKFREMKIFEEIAGVPIGAWGTISTPTSDMLVAAVYISMRRDDPTLTVDTVWDTMDLEMVDFDDSPTVAEPTPLKSLEQPEGTTRRKKAS